MARLVLAVAAWMALGLGEAVAGETLIYGPVPAWVRPLPIPAPSGAASTPAIADFDLASTSNREGPRARALYGRGLARLRRGMKTEGATDLAAARAVDPKVADYFARSGLAP